MKSVRIVLVLVLAVMLGGCSGQSFGKVPANSPNLVREWMNFYFGEREKANIDEVVAFLHQEGIISVDKLPEGTVDDSLTRKVFKASGHKPVASGAALGVIEGRSAADCPFKD